MSYNVLEIGLPFFDDINKQCRNKPYFTSYLAEWISIKDRFPSFQFFVPIDDLTITDFDLINVDTGVATSYLTHFLAEATSHNGDIRKWWLYDGDTALSVTPANGRYYFYVKSTDGIEKYSEVFLMTSETMTEISYNRFVNIGLPFFDKKEKQVSSKSYFNSHLVNWLSANNRFPNFQFIIGIPGISSFYLVNSETGVQTDFLTHLNSNVIVTDIDGEFHYTYMANEDVSVENGMYYFMLESATGEFRYSEEFVMCGGITASNDYLLIGVTDYLLLDSTDKLKIG